jgi:hypothetical protein
MAVCAFKFRQPEKAAAEGFRLLFSFRLILRRLGSLKGENGFSGCLKTA